MKQKGSYKPHFFIPRQQLYQIISLILFQYVFYIFLSFFHMAKKSTRAKRIPILTRKLSNKVQRTKPLQNKNKSRLTLSYKYNNPKSDRGYKKLYIICQNIWQGLGLPSHVSLMASFLRLYRRFISPVLQFTRRLYT